MLRATRLHGGCDQYCTGRTASSSRPKRRKVSHPAANFYSIRAFTLSIKSAVDYEECSNCKHGAEPARSLYQGETADLARSMTGEQELAVLGKRGVFELLVGAIYALRVLHKARGAVELLILVISRMNFSKAWPSSSKIVLQAARLFGR